MSKVLIYILLFMASIHLAMATKENDKLEQTKTILKTLLPFHKKDANNKFSVQKCKLDQSKWMMLLIGKQPFTEKVSFNKQCDIEGQYTAKMNIPFPVNLKLQSLKNFDKVKFNFLLQLIYDPIPMIKIFMQNGILSGPKDIIKYDLEYAAEIDPLSKGFIKKDKGGKIRIHSINGKKVNEIIPIKR